VSPEGSKENIELSSIPVDEFTSFWVPIELNRLLLEAFGLLQIAPLEL